MKKLTAVILAAIMLCTVFCLTGCKDKVSITAEDFRIAMEAAGHTVVDATEQFADHDEVVRVYVAKLGEGDHQIEFYEMDSVASAQMIQEGNKAIFEQVPSSFSSHSNFSLANYSNYRRTAAGYFMVASRIDNTMIYVNTPVEFKDEIKDILDQLGY